MVADCEYTNVPSVMIDQVPSTVVQLSGTPSSKSSKNKLVETLLTVTAVAGLEVVLFPAASRAVAVSECDPLVVVVLFQEIEYGLVVSSVPRFAPSNLNCTPTTPTLSLALADTVMVPDTVAPLVGAVMETVGAMASGAVVVNDQHALKVLSLGMVAESLARLCQE